MEHPRPSPRAIAWAAGLFEGEGCIQITRERQLMINLVSTDADVIGRFACVVGVGSLARKVRTNPEPQWKPAWTWRCYGAAADTLLRAFLPHLGARRRKDAERSLAVRRDAQREANRIRQCPVCRLLFRPRPGPGAKGRIYCSTNCARLHAEEIRLARVAAHRAPTIA